MFYMFYMLLSCVLTLMFREICHFNQSNGPFHLVACQWLHTSSTKEYSAQDACVGAVFVRYNGVYQRVTYTHTR